MRNLFLGVAFALALPAAALAHGMSGGHGGGHFDGGPHMGGVHNVEFHGDHFGRFHRGRFFHGVWWDYGAGPCWQWSPAGWVWVCS